MRNRVFAWLLAVLLALTPVLAIAEGSAQGNGESDPLKIDTYWKYPGMEKSYAGGYLPTESDTAVRFILPLIGKTGGGVIRVVPEFPPDGPFAANNLQFDVREKTYDVTQGADKTGRMNAYLIDFSAPLKDPHYKGTYTVQFHTSYKTAAGDPAEQTFSVQVTIKNGKTQSSGGGGGQSSVKKPVILVEACTIAPTAVSGGDTVSFRLSLKNVGNRDAKNIRISAVPESDALKLEGDLNATFLDKLAINGTVDADFLMSVVPGATEGDAVVQTTITYEDIYGGSYTEEGKYRVKITQPKVALTECTYPEVLAGGEAFPLTLKLQNTGTHAVQNVRVTVVPETETLALRSDSEVLRTETLAPSAALDAAGELTVVPGAPEGDATLLVTVEYEDAHGGLYTEETRCRIRIVQPKLEITDCVYSEIVSGGEDFTATLTVKNAGSRDAKDVAVRFVSEDGSVRKKGMEDFVRVGELKHGESTTVTLELRAQPSASEGRHDMAFVCVYGDAAGTGLYTQELRRDLTIYQKASLGFDEIRLPESLTSGETFVLPICVFNTGFSPVYNVRGVLSVDGLICSSAYLGNIEPQDSATKELSVFVTTLQGSAKYGETWGNFQIYFEDENGEEQYLYQDLKSSIAEPVKITDEEKLRQEQEQKEQQTLSQWWISLLVAIAVIIILIAIIVIARFARIMKMK